jgi:elongation factor Tu
MSGFVFFDILEPTDGPPTLRVRAQLHAHRTDEGGRQRSIHSGYRPDLNFGSPESREFYVGAVTWPDDAVVRPGESREVVVEFINARGLAEQLAVGRSWRIQEGSRLVATAKVLEIMREA